MADEFNSLESAAVLVEPVDDEVPAAPSRAAIPQPVSPELRNKSWSLRSVLKVFVTRVDPNYAQPWQMCPQRSATGSAFVIDLEKRLILTNAHVVTNATAVYVRRPGNAKKFKAEVVCEGKMADLALITVHDDAFWAVNLKPLEFVDVPELQSPIAVVGYPVGGDSLSITKGIVSRLTMVRYSAAVRLLGIQIDAAINPGNSGGPAFADLENGKVAGVAFSKNVSSSTDNIGYIIPWQVVQHFVAEHTRHGKYRGVPCGGFIAQDMENPAQRSYLQVPEHCSGVVVVNIDPLSSAHGVVQKNDVVVEVDGHPVADDGTITFRDDERVEYTHVIRSKFIGEQLTLKIIRGGQEMNVSYELQRKDYLVPVLHNVDCVPSYFIAAGLVFMPLTHPFLDMVFGGKKRRDAMPLPVLSALNMNKTKPDQQIVILVQVLAHELNHGYKYTVIPCENFNGKKLRNLRHLADMVDACQEPFLNFELEGGRLITIDREEAVKHGPSILQVHAISSDRSSDLKEPLALTPSYSTDSEEALAVPLSACVDMGGGTHDS